MKFTRKLTCLLVLAALLLSTIAIPALAASSDGNAGAYIWSKVSNNAATNRAWSREKQFEGEAQDIYKDTDTVRVSILLDEPSTMDKFGYKSSKNLSSSNAAMTYRAGLLEKQNKLAARIEKEALRGKKLDVVWNLTLAANIISANILFGEIDRIAAVKGVKGVYVENVYEMDGFDAGEAPTQSIGTAMTKTNSAWASGYTGAGSIVAIVDTGLDTTHELFDPDAFMYAIEEDWENGKEFELLDEEKLAETLPLLNLSTRGDYEASDLYLNAKIPLAFNYSENNLNVGHLNDIQSEHGTHVTSIAAGNRYVKDGNGGYAPSLEKVLTQGQAPDAQVIVIKYFSARTGTDADYFAAIEDCILLGVDSVNLSLGSSTVSGLSINRVYEEIFKKIENSDLTMVCSAGNTGSWASHLGIFSYLYSQDKNMSTGGSPGSYTTAMAVGSADNDGSTGPYIGYEGEQIFFSQTSGYGNEPISTLSGTYEFIYIDSPGTDEDFAAVADVLEGKIAVCNRGTTSFYEKANAAISNGAIATVIVNNQAGVINMNLTGYLYTNPAVSIQLADGLYIKATAEAVKDEEENILYYKGEFNLSDDIASVNYGSVNYTISSFSSWGTPGNLTLKPEIVAPGGSIYAANGRHKNEDGVTYSGGSDQYELMSGTSMASPQVAGIVATLAQYIRENNLQEKTGLSERQLALSLLMSTATPMIQDGTYYPIQQQGSGFVNAEAAVNSGTVILMGEDATAYAAD
ncbi:MAG: S8 family serine peptidase, partial [Clostridia bacterium]|nr:S8 family serine peptidase [Clostridia bacterium]